MPVLDPAHTALLNAFRLFPRHPFGGEGVRTDFGPSTLNALMERWDFPDDAKRAIVWVPKPGMSAPSKLISPTQVKAVRDTLVEEGTLIVAKTTRGGTPTAWAFTPSSPRFSTRDAYAAAMRALFDAAPPTPPVKAPTPPVKPPTPTTIADALRPFVDGDTDDLELSADAVTDAFRREVSAQIDPDKVFRALTWTPQDKETQSYGFEDRPSRSASNQRGWDLYGTLTYPARVTGTLRGGVDLRACWLAALDRTRRMFRPGTDLTTITIDPARSPLAAGGLFSIVRDLCAAWTIAEPTLTEADDIADALWKQHAIDDDSETTFYDYNGEEEPTVEGFSAQFNFRFRAMQDTPPTATVTALTGWTVSIAFRVPLRVLVDIEAPE